MVREDQGAPERSAEDSLKTIVVPPGYRAELVAKEPLVQDPILIDFDADGRMWVVEMPAFAAGEGMKDSREGICRVVVLEDGPFVQTNQLSPLMRQTMATLFRAQGKQAAAPRLCLCR